MRVMVSSQKEAIEVARVLTRAANSLRYNYETPNLETQTNEHLLCLLRDNIKIYHEKENAEGE